MKRDLALTLLDRLHAAQAAFHSGGSADELRTQLDERVVWRVPGDNAIAGTYSGIDEVLAYFERRRALAAGTFRMERRDLLTGDGDTIASLTDGVATIRGKEHRWSTVGLYRFRNQVLVECTLLPLDPDEFDRVWSAKRDTSLLGRIAVAGSQLANRHGLYLGPRSAAIHVALYRRTGGRLGGHLPGLPDARVLLLDHTGARSGIRRTSPVMYHEEGDRVAVAASKGGQPTNPAWFFNLKANPETTIQIGRVVRAVRARVATDEERDRLWPKFLAFYPGYDFLQLLARDRKIPIVIFDSR